jgi:cell division protein ZapA
VRILEKEYIVACGPDERTDLLDSAEILNKSMREIRDSGKIAGLDRIAVMAALNLAHEVLKLRARDVGADHDTGHRIKALRERVESALEKGQQLEL